MNDATTTRDIKDALIRVLSRCENLTGEDLRCELSSVIDQLLSSSVSVTQVVPVRRSSPVPAYNPECDGDYSHWLVSNNID